MSFSANRPQGHKPGKPKTLESSVASARRYFGWLLGRREYAASELRSKAGQKGYLPEHVDEALSFLQSHGLQNDARYAGMKARQTAGRYGDRVVAQRLLSKRLDAQIVREEVAALDDEKTRASALLARMSANEWTTELKQKAWRKLASRGFSSESIKAALRQLEEAARER